MSYLWFSLLDIIYKFFCGKESYCLNMKLSYEINKDLDKEMAINFLGYSAGGIDFSKAVIGPHPDLNGIDKYTIDKQKEIIDQYFDKFYNEHAEEILKKKDQFNQKWNEVENQFFDAVSKLFNNKIEIADKYTGYLSIVNCNPRFVEDSAFQIFWQNKKGSIYVTCHELLHFVFFDYVKRFHFETLGKLSTDEGLLWEISEIFNDIILILPEFSKIHGQNTLDHYPVLEKHIDAAGALWKESADIDIWLRGMTKYLR